MKAKTALFAMIITLAAVISGFFMPSVICSIQDNRREAQVMNHESGSIQLVFTDAGSLADKLVLIKNGYSRVDLEKGKTLDKSGAQKAAAEVLTWLGKYGFYTGTYNTTNFSCTPFVATSTEDTALSSVFWECDLQDDFGNLVKILIDDESGKMVAITYAWLKADSDKTITTYVYKSGRADEFAAMCLKYYGFSKLDIPNINSNGYSDEYIFLYTDKSGKSYSVPFVIAKSFYNFNP